MTFPVTFHIFGHAIPSHLAMEILAYSGGFQLCRFLRRREVRRDPSKKRSTEQQLWIIAGAVGGAAVGSKILAWVESGRDYWAHRSDPAVWTGGKTIVGGLLGGWAGVEIAKRFLRLRGSSGDAWVFPLLFGTAVGRVGCFLTGLDDHTYGVATSLPWGVDFGDGIRRHPTQLYEIAFVLLLAVALRLRAKVPTRDGELFRLYLAGYLFWRFAVEFIKPSWKPYFGVSAIQIASVIGAALALRSLFATDQKTESICA